MNQLNEKIQNVILHKALNNEFYSKWCGGKLPLADIKIFAANYGEFTSSFPGNLALLISKTEDLIVRAQYSQILYSELGSGDYTKSHSLLFKKFCEDLFSYLESGNKKNDTNHLEVLPTTKQLLKGQQELYTQDIIIAVGAQLALETQAYAMISQLYEGALNYISCWPSKIKFHESCEFFYAHIGATEKEHYKEALEAVNKITQSKEDFEKVISGFDAHLDLFADFWEGISEKMVGR